MHRSHGFTLVELVLVIVLVGIISAVAIPRFFDRNTFEERGFFNVALSAVRYAHKLAVASGCHIAVSVNASGITLLRDATCSGTTFTQPIHRPGSNDSFSEAAPGGVAVGSAAFYFDGAGRPYTSATTTLLATALDISVGTLTLRVEPESGYSHEP
jgi:MSHA pilin protein MshC